MTNASEHGDREYSTRVISSFGSIAALLGGFSFTALTVLLTSPVEQRLFGVAFVVTSVSTVLWVSIAVMGACLDVAAANISLVEGSPLFGMATIFAYSVYAGIILFFGNVSVFAFLVSPTLGFAVTGLALLSTVLLFAAVAKIGGHWGR
jgi:hypothetical protein